MTATLEQRQSLPQGDRHPIRQDAGSLVSSPALLLPEPWQVGSAQLVASPQGWPLDAAPAPNTSAQLPLQDCLTLCRQVRALVCTHQGLRWCVPWRQGQGVRVSH